MNRRDSLKALVVGGISASVLLDACKQLAKDGKETSEAGSGAKAASPDRMTEENLADQQIAAMPKFFNEN